MSQPEIQIEAQELISRLQNRIGGLVGENEQLTILAEKYLTAYQDTKAKLEEAEQSLVELAPADAPAQGGTQ